MDGVESDDWYDPDTTTFGDRLAGAREAAEMTQVALARRLGVAVKTLRAWEEDRSDPRANRVQMLAGLLNVPLAWLLSGEGDGPAVAAADGAGDLLGEVTRLRRDAVRLTERLAVLEAKLQGRASDDAADPT